jgi:serine/threonine protein kinase/WD40 repeat protein
VAGEELHTVSDDGEHVFVVLGELGRGAMGSVLLARDVRADREVALKLAMDETSPTSLARFKREGELTAALDHPGIVKVHFSGTIEGRAFLAYEVVEGCRTLDRALPDLSANERAALVRDAARALGHAHALGIVHRDVKPGNLLVDDQGRLRVADFGLATALDLERLTRTGTMAGTPSYMAPEQIAGKKGTTGPTCDVWALGVVLYEALTGVLPFGGVSLMELLAKILAGRPQPPTEHDPTLSPSLSAICMRALMADPAERYADGEALARDVDRALSGESTEAEGASRTRGPGLAVLGMCALLLGIGSVGWIWGRPAGDPSGAPLTAGSDSPTSTAQGGLNAGAILEGDRALARLQRQVEAPRIVEGCERWLASFDEHPRKEEVLTLLKHWRLRMPLHAILHPTGGRRARVYAAFLPGGRIASCSSSKAASRRIHVWAIGVDGLRAVHTTPRFQGRVEQTLLLPGGRRALALLAKRAPLVWSIEGGVGRSLGDRLRVGKHIFGCARAWQGGTILALGGSDKLVLASLDSEEAVLWVRDVEVDQGTLVHALTLSPDGSRMVLALGRGGGIDTGSIAVYQVEDPPQLLKSAGVGAPALSLAVDPLGTYIVVGTRGGQILRLGIDALESLGEYLVAKKRVGSFGLELGRDAHAGSVRGLAFSPEGEHLYSVAHQGTPSPQNELKVWNAKSRTELRQAHVPNRPLAVEVSPDGGLLLLSTDLGAELWRAR